MADARTNADNLRQLVALWEQLAKSGSDLSSDESTLNRLCVDVIARFQSAASSLAGVWLNQALAIGAWNALADKIQQESITVVPYSEWDALRDQVEQLQRRVEDEQRAAKTRVTNLLPFAKEQQKLFADLAAYFRQSQDAFAKLAETAVPVTEHLTPSQTLQEQIEQALAAMPSGWPPARLAGFLARLPERDGFVERLQRCLDSTASEWRVALGAAMPAVANDLREAVVLLRGLVEGFSACDSAAAVWSQLAALARELLPADQIQVELIRDPKQPAAWFESPSEAEIRLPRVACVGLAVRLAGRDWLCFPLGRLLIPKPRARTVADEAADALATIAGANPWLQRFAPHPQAIRAAMESPGDRALSDLILPALDDLVADAGDAAPSFRELPSEKIQALDRLTGSLRAVAAGDGLEILPRAWRFAQPPSYTDLEDDEKNHVVVFRPDDPRGRIYRMRVLGLKRGEELIRPCSVSVSAGPLPFGFRELENLVKDDPKEAVIRDRLRGWRDAALEGTLELTAVQFFVDFWGALGDGLRQHDPERARELGQRLTELLQRDFRLFPFHPAAFQDFPDGWIQRTPGRQMTTGLVRRVIRPGLQDEHNHLRVPALVEVE